MLAAALLALVLYAAFSHGAVGSPAEARLQVVLAGIAAVAGGAWLWSGTLRFSAPRRAVAGIGLLSAFALWSAVTLLWSVAPDNTWLELNRVLTYVIVLVLAVVLGASTKRAVGLISEGFVLVATAVTLYGLGQKLVPGLHIGGLFDLNQTGALPRLQEPLGYWNALALLLALGAPVAVMITVDTGRSVRTRLAALAALQLMLLAIGFTYFARRGARPRGRARRGDRLRRGMGALPGMAGSRGARGAAGAAVRPPEPRADGRQD